MKPPIFYILKLIQNHVETAKQISTKSCKQVDYILHIGYFSSQKAQEMELSAIYIWILNQTISSQIYFCSLSLDTFQLNIKRWKPHPVLFWSSNETAKEIFTKLRTQLDYILAQHVCYFSSQKSIRDVTTVYFHFDMELAFIKPKILCTVFELNSIRSLLSRIITAEHISYAKNNLQKFTFIKKASSGTKIQKRLGN